MANVEPGLGEEQPHDERERTDGERDDGEVERRAVGEILGLRLRRLRLADEPDDLAEVRLLARPLDLDGERARPVDAPGDHLVPVPFLDRDRLAGERRLVDGAPPLHDGTVGGNFLARLHEHAVARAERARRHVLDLPVRSDSVGLVGHQPGQFFERRRRPHHAPHLDPVADEHEVDERRRLPEKQLAVEAEHDGERVKEGDGDRHRDERHHPRPPVAQFLDHAREEGPAAPAVDERGDRGEHPGRAGEREGEPGPVLNHRTEREDRDGEGEADEEAAAEVGHHHRVVLVVPAATVPLVLHTLLPIVRACGVVDAFVRVVGRVVLLSGTRMAVGVRAIGAFVGGLAELGLCQARLRLGRRVGVVGTVHAWAR